MQVSRAHAGTDVLLARSRSPTRIEESAWHSRDGSRATETAALPLRISLALDQVDATGVDRVLASMQDVR